MVTVNINSNIWNYMLSQSNNSVNGFLILPFSLVKPKYDKLVKNNVNAKTILAFRHWLEIGIQKIGTHFWTQIHSFFLFKINKIMTSNWPRTMRTKDNKYCDKWVEALHLFQGLSNNLKTTWFYFLFRSFKFKMIHLQMNLERKKYIFLHPSYLKRYSLYFLIIFSCNNSI